MSRDGSAAAHLPLTIRGGSNGGDLRANLSAVRTTIDAATLRRFGVSWSALCGLGIEARDKIRQRAQDMFMEFGHCGGGVPFSNGL